MEPVAIIALLYCIKVCDRSIEKFTDHQLLFKFGVRFTHLSSFNRHAVPPPFPTCATTAEAEIAQLSGKAIGKSR